MKLQQFNLMERNNKGSKTCKWIS